MGYLLYLMFRCDFDVMESLEELGELNTALAVFYAYTLHVKPCDVKPCGPSMEAIQYRYRICDSIRENGRNTKDSRC